MKVGDLIKHNRRTGAGYDKPCLILKMGQSGTHHHGHILICDEGYVYWDRAKEYVVISESR